MTAPAHKWTLLAPLKSSYEFHVKHEHRSDNVNYRDHPAFKFITGTVLCLVGVGHIVLVIARHSGDLIRGLLGVAFFFWGASLIWQSIKKPSRQ